MKLLTVAVIKRKPKKLRLQLNSKPPSSEILDLAAVQQSKIIFIIATTYSVKGNHSKEDGSGKTGSSKC